MTSSGSWTAFTVSGTAPVGAVYVHPRLVLSPGTVSASTIVYVDTLLLDMRASPRTWHVGENQPRVMIEATRETVARIGTTSQSYTIVELSA